ncbi:hypothetical protein [Phytohabitans kaempferiae]|uniref:Peptidoglycan binding-like domain-containing protein n=1 Tax=Phytohabitans kaempferiae TaxID=1620943 RepID=A0ABV6LY87_9ACTN
MVLARKLVPPLGQVGDAVGDSAGPDPSGDVECVVAELAGVLGLCGGGGGVEAGDQRGMQGSSAYAALAQVQGLFGVSDGLFGAAEVEELLLAGAQRVDVGQGDPPAPAM